MYLALFAVASQFTEHRLQGTLSVHDAYIPYKYTAKTFLPSIKPQLVSSLPKFLFSPASSTAWRKETELRF